MEQINKIELRGAVGNVSVQTYPNGKVAHLTLATNYAYKDKNGAAVIDTTWHNITAWEGRDITGLEQIDKGTKLYVLGRLRYQKYTSADGVERTSADIVANRIQIIPNQQELSYEM